MQAIKLSELTGKIHQTIHQAFADQLFWVMADVTNHSFKAKESWHFFTLAEKQEGTHSILAKAETVAWKAGSIKIEHFEKITGQPFRNDIHVLVKVSVDYNSSFGLRLTLHDIDTNFTVGVLEQQKQAILQQLLTDCSSFIQKSGEHYITRNSQLSLHPVIRKLAIITSHSSAGFEDFKHILESNPHRYTFSIDHYFTAVQGEANAGAIRQKLLEVHQSGQPYDAVIIIRGGGAQTDFLIFDTFQLGQIVAKFPIPIITGIGHQRNETIVDLMAHTATNAPTKAAEFIIEHNRKFEEGMLDMQKSILIKAQQMLSGRQRLLTSIETNIVNQSRDLIAGHKDRIMNTHQSTINTAKTILFKGQKTLVEISNQLLSRPRSILSNKQNDLENSISNLSVYNRNFIQNQRSYIAHCVTVFNLMSPANILKKGFAIVYHQGKITSNPDLIAAGDDISVRLADTEISAVVTTKKQANGTEFKL